MQTSISQLLFNGKVNSHYDSIFPLFGAKMYRINMVATCKFVMLHEACDTSVILFKTKYAYKRDFCWTETVAFDVSTTHIH